MRRNLQQAGRVVQRRRIELSCVRAAAPAAHQRRRVGSGGRAYLATAKSRINDGSEPFRFLSDAQLQAECQRCLGCETQPCMTACPVGCNPRDFIRRLGGGVSGDAAAERLRKPSKVDLKLAAAEIMEKNPLGGVCGATCPDSFCVSACARQGLDRPVDIPSVQATIVRRAREQIAFPEWEKVTPAASRRRGVDHQLSVAVIGGGPAGLAAAGMLSRFGYRVEVFDSNRGSGAVGSDEISCTGTQSPVHQQSDEISALGGVVKSIPRSRLPRGVLEEDVHFIRNLGDIHFHHGQHVSDANIREMVDSGDFDAVCVATGLPVYSKAGFEGEIQYAIQGMDVLWEPAKFDSIIRGKNVAIVGGGAVSADAATTCVDELGAASVVITYRKGSSDLKMSKIERESIEARGIDIIYHTQPLSFDPNRRVLVVNQSWGKNHEGGPVEWPEVDVVLTCIGSRPAHAEQDFATVKNIFFAGDVATGSSTVVQSAAQGKAAAMRIRLCLEDEDKVGKSTKQHEMESLALQGRGSVPGFVELPTPLQTGFFDRTLINPFVLSASPLTDSLEVIREAYAAGWAGVITKTAFSQQHILVPGGYMKKFGPDTFGNADNVSAVPLETVCEFIRILVKEYPERVTMGSTGGSLTGNDAADRASWQHHTSMLEAAGAHGIEYSLSCPQGAEGAEGKIASQSAKITRKIVEWVLEKGDPRIPKLFKLSGAVTSIETIAEAVKNAMDKFPDAKAGITLANSFPVVAFDPNTKPVLKHEIDHEAYTHAVVVGMAGRGVNPISNMNLASVSHLGLFTSGNGGAMDYRSAANFIALGASHVQMCTAPTVHGLNIITDLKKGLSHALLANEIPSVENLRGSALPVPVTDFMDLDETKKISTLDKETCVSCGNCTRCPYGAISMVPDLEAGGILHPVIRADRCIGCNHCIDNCPSNSLSLQTRTAEQLRAQLSHESELGIVAVGQDPPQLFAQGIPGADSATASRRKIHGKTLFEDSLS